MLRNWLITTHILEGYWIKVFKFKTETRSDGSEKLDPGPRLKEKKRKKNEVSMCCVIKLDTWSILSNADTRLVGYPVQNY